MANPVELVGRQVGRYTVLSHLASGGMAELYIARQQSVGGFEKQVVLKILQPRYAKNPRVVTMFLDEARLAAKLNHPAIVHVYDVADEGGLKYIAMEYIHGETIADIVKRGLAVDRYLPMEHAIHILRQTAAGLAYAHERREADGKVVRIVHRDVSPTNVLVSYEGQTEIVDFGIARAQDELREEAGILPGKASYMSPEQVRGETVDHRSDIFALGIILYELTLCQRLYRGPADAVMKRIVNERVQPPTAIRRDYPASLELIVMRALEKRPDDRYQSAQELHDDLEEFLSESGLRSGNRRVAIYMNELFAPDAAAHGAPAADEPEELDFDRRAPLSMRIEPASESQAPREQAREQAKEQAREQAKEQARGQAREVVKRPSQPAVASVAPPPAPPAGRPFGVASAPPPGDAGPQFGSPAGRTRGSWIVLATFIVLGIGAMVFLTLR